MTRKGIAHVLLATFAFLNLGVEAAASALRALPATVAILLDLEVRPFAIAHRGFGDNRGEDPARPIENTIRAVRAGYTAGASVVEVDVQLTSDGEVAVYHDDFLPDLTCLNRLTLSELQERLPHVPSLQAVLQQARKFNDGSRPTRGLLIVELKAPAPLCDPDDTQERVIVSTVARVIRRMRMTEQVLLTSFSPALLWLARDEAPEIARVRAVSGLLFLTAAEIEAELGLPVTLVDKDVDVGLQWAEIGALFRLPGYADVDQLLATAAALGVRVIEADLDLLDQAGQPLVNAVHAQGLKAFGFTATTPEEWFFLEALGLDGIYTNDVPFGVLHQATRSALPEDAQLLGAR
jgi:glycerophosphoryl diester phosphodiesterase